MHTAGSLFLNKAGKEEIVKMLDEINRHDLRVRKVEKSLTEAMSILLNKQNFGKITIKDLCNEALISRATFYAHYADKYNMLEYWLFKYQPYKLEKDVVYEQAEETTNRFVHENEKIIINLFDDADNETLEILSRYILYLLDFAKKEYPNEQRLKSIVLSNFYSGGIIYFIVWLIKNKFPSDVPAMNIHLYRLIEKMRELEIA